MLSGFSKAVLFTSSLSPLLIVFALLDYWGPGWPTATCVIVAAASWAGTAALTRLGRSLAPSFIVAHRIDRKDQEILTYLVANLLPFLSIHPEGQYQ